MILIHQQIKYAKSGSEITKIGGISKTNNVIRRAEQLANIEQLFINQAEKAIRAENQRNARRAQR